MGAPAAVAVLTDAASLYAVITPAADECWYGDALELLTTAGVDPAEARAIRLADSTHFAGPVGSDRIVT